MYLSKSEKLCKWLLLGLILLNIASPFLWNHMQMTKHMRGFQYDIIAFALTMSAIISAISMIGWAMICQEKKTGKYFLLFCHIPSAVVYSIGILYFSVVLLAGFESYLALRFLLPLLFEFLVSVSVIVLQHFWTRYIL